MLNIGNAPCWGEPGWEYIPGHGQAPCRTVQRCLRSVWESEGCRISAAVRPTATPWPIPRAAESKQVEHLWHGPSWAGPFIYLSARWGALRSPPVQAHPRRGRRLPAEPASLPVPGWGPAQRPAAPAPPREGRRHGGRDGRAPPPPLPLPPRRIPGRAAGARPCPARLRGSSAPSVPPPDRPGSGPAGHAGEGIRGPGEAGEPGEAAVTRGHAGSGGPGLGGDACLRRTRVRLALGPPSIPRASPEHPPSVPWASPERGRRLRLSRVGFGSARSWPRPSSDPERACEVTCSKHSAVNALLCLSSPELWAKLVRPRGSKALSFLLELTTVMLHYQNHLSVFYWFLPHTWAPTQVASKGHHVETGNCQKTFSIVHWQLTVQIQWEDRGF